MATSWPSVARTDYAADDSVPQECARGVRAVHECVLRRPPTIYFTEQTTASATYVDMWDFNPWVPCYWLAGRYFYLEIEAYRSAATAASWQVVDKDNGDAVISDEVSVTAAAYADSGPCTVTIPSGWTVNARRNLAIQGKIASANTLYLRCLTRFESYASD